MTLFDLKEWLSQNGVAEKSLPSWFHEWQSQHRSQLLSLGLPTRKNERWKYVDFTFLKAFDYTKTSESFTVDLTEIIHQQRLAKTESILMVFVNGIFMPSHSDIHKLPTGSIVCSLQDALIHHPELIEKYLMTIDAKKYPFANLNISLCSNGLFFYLPDNCELSQPIHLISIPFNETFVAHPQHLFVLGKQTKLTIFDEYFSLTENEYCINVMMSIFVGKFAQLKYYKLQQEGKYATHMAHTFVYQEQNSDVTLNHFANGSYFARDEIQVVLDQTDAACHAFGFYHLHHDNQYVDHHVEIIHKAARTQSEMLYKGIADKKSRAVFNGRLLVEKNAQKILAHQANHHLLLSNQAESYSKPELEIYADDVKCKHGATTGQVDQNALFYLRTRGIPQDEALQILLQGFAHEMIERVEHLAIKQRVKDWMCL